MFSLAVAEKLAHGERIRQGKFIHGDEKFRVSSNTSSSFPNSAFLSFIFSFHPQPHERNEVKDEKEQKSESRKVFCIQFFRRSLALVSSLWIRKIVERAPRYFNNN